MIDSQRKCSEAVIDLKVQALSELSQTGQIVREHRTRNDVSHREGKVVVEEVEDIRCLSWRRRVLKWRLFWGFLANGGQRT